MNWKFEIDQIVQPKNQLFNYKVSFIVKLRVINDDTKKRLYLIYGASGQTVVDADSAEESWEIVQ